MGRLLIRQRRSLLLCAVGIALSSLSIVQHGSQSASSSFGCVTRWTSFSSPVVFASAMDMVVDSDDDEFEDDDDDVFGSLGGSGAVEDPVMHLETTLGLPLDQIKQRIEDILLDYVDLDQNGEVTREELVDWLEFLHDKVLTRALDEKMKTLDANKDGAADLDEVMEDSMAASLEEGVELTEEEQKEIKIRFDAIDEDQSGLLEYDELMVLMDSRQLEKSAAIEARVTVKDNDENEDGKVSFEEFSKGRPSFEDLLADDKDLIDPKFQLTPEEKSKRAFESFDTDKDGQLTVEELTQAYLSKKGTSLHFEEPLKEFIESNVDELMKDALVAVQKKERQEKEDETKKGDEDDEAKEKEDKDDGKEVKEKEEKEVKEEKKDGDEKKDDEKKDDEKKVESVKIADILGDMDLLHKWALSALTDMGDVIKSPEEYHLEEDDDDDYEEEDGVGEKEHGEEKSNDAGGETKVVGTDGEDEDEGEMGEGAQNLMALLEKLAKEGGADFNDESLRNMFGAAGGSDDDFSSDDASGKEDDEDEGEKKVEKEEKEEKVEKEEKGEKEEKESEGQDEVKEVREELKQGDKTEKHDEL